VIPFVSFSRSCRSLRCFPWQNLFHEIPRICKSLLAVCAINGLANSFLRRLKLDCSHESLSFCRPDICQLFNGAGTPLLRSWNQNERNCVLPDRMQHFSAFPNTAEPLLGRTCRWKNSNCIPFLTSRDGRNYLMPVWQKIKEKFVLDVLSYNSQLQRFFVDFKSSFIHSIAKKHENLRIFRIRESKFQAPRQSISWSQFPSQYCHKFPKKEI